jgi:UTP--glucose-1-phosphate uridylyltransferase
MLPATKTVPKELLPLVDKPVLQYIVEEAVESGVEDIIIITSRGKQALVEYFLPNPGLEKKLHALGKHTDAERIRQTAEMARFHFVIQEEQKGLGHAIWCAREAVGDEPFGVLRGADILYSETPGLRQLIEAAEKFDLPAVATHEVDDEHVVKYSSLLLEPLERNIYRLLDMNEKPSLEEKFSNYAILGRYVLTPEIFGVLERTPPGRNNEIQLTDGMRELCLQSGMVAVDFEGRRYDTGNPNDYVETFLDFALRDPVTREHTRRLILEKARGFGEKEMVDTAANVHI